MPYRIIGLVLAVCGVVAATLGVASATVWRDDPTVTASTPTSVDGPTLVTTAPGVLDLVNDRVDITVRAAGGGDVVVAVGRTEDVTGWVGDDPVAQVTGLRDWSSLKTTTVSGETPKTAPDPSSSDMWVAETTGTGSATLPWTARAGQWSVLAASVGDDAQAPTLELTWDRQVTTPWLWPLVLAGFVLVAAGLVVISIGRHRSQRKQQEATRAVARTAVPPPPAPGAPGPGAPAGSPSTTTTLTRRELREQAQREAQEQARRRGRQRQRGGKGGAPEAADGAAAVPAYVEPEPSTVAIPVDETAKGAADAWRRRWNVPARIPPATGGAPAPGAAPAGPVAPPPADGDGAPPAAPGPGPVPGVPGWDDIVGGGDRRRGARR